jgi:hypothetical protein
MFSRQFGRCSESRLTQPTLVSWNLETVSLPSKSSRILIGTSCFMKCTHLTSCPRIRTDCWHCLSFLLYFSSILLLDPLRCIHHVEPAHTVLQQPLYLLDYGPIHNRSPVYPQRPRRRHRGQRKRNRYLQARTSDRGVSL